MKAQQEPFDLTSDELSEGVLRVSGELDMMTTPILERWIRGAELRGNPVTVLDLERVSFMDSSGLHCLLLAAERANSEGRDFGVINAAAIVRRVLHLTNADHLLTADLPPAVEQQTTAIAL